MPRRKKKTVRVEAVEAEEVKTTVEVTANPESTEPENVTITRDENGEIISVQPTQELIDQQNAEVEEEEEKTEEETEEAETEEAETPVNENELFLNNDSSEAAESQKDNSAETESPEEESEEEKAESTTEPLIPAANSRWIASQIITDPYGRRSVGYQPNPSKAVFTKADNQWNASVTVFGRRGEERIRRDWTSL